MTELSERCCSLPPFKSDYVPIGQTFTISVEGQKDLDIYTVGPEDATTALVAICDIFGFHRNTLAGTDLLAKATGYRIVMPDFFRGETWPVENMPPKEGRAALKAWIDARGSWDQTRPALLATVNNLKQNGATTIGAYGFCFGAKKLVECGDENLFRSMAIVHPSFFRVEDADDVRVPVALIPSKDEDKDMINGFWDKIQQKNEIAAQSVRLDFTDMHHGFAAARSNWADPQHAKRARDCYEGMRTFFKSTL